MSPLLTRSMCRLAKVANAGVHLEGKDAAKFESLRARMANEQQDYLKVLRTKAFADHARYTSCHALAAQQIEVLSIQDACSTWQHLSLLCLTPRWFMSCAYIHQGWPLCLKVTACQYTAVCAQCGGAKI